MQASQPRFLSLAAKTAVCHTITYFCMGLLAFHFLHYAEIYARPCSGMRQVSEPLVRAGLLFQPLRGILFAAVFYPFRERLFGRKGGWLVMGWMLVGLGIFGAFAAASGSMEGFIYSTAPIREQMQGWLEIVPQALLLSALLCYWVNHPQKKWLSWTLSIVCILLIGVVILGLLVPAR
jgi:hypothetical protein